MKKSRNIVLLLCTLMLGATDAAAVSQAGGMALQFNTSAAAEGMGGAGVASWWGNSPNHWSNPALLSSYKGIHYNGFYSKLAAGLADDVDISNHEIILGNFGVGVLYGDTPLPGVKLNQGEQTATDENGNVVGTFTSYQTVKKLGVGLDLIRVADSVMGWLNTDPGLSRFASIAGGITHKDFRDYLVPDQFTQDQVSGTGEGSCNDYGVVFRVSPSALALLALNQSEGGRGTFETIEPKLEGAYGYSWQSWTDDQIVFAGVDQSDPFPRQTLKGWSLDAELAVGPRLSEKLRREKMGFLVETLSPLLCFRYANQTLDSDVPNDETVIDGHGWEVGLLNVLYLRRGHVEDPEGGTVGDTKGWGINLQFGEMGGLRYDEATVPQITGFPSVDRQSWSAWVCPMEIMEALKN